MNPKEFEIMVAKFFKMQGYDTKLTPYSGDWGIDVIATKGKEKVAVQAKMYGDSARKVSRLAMMQLYGAMAYQDCTRAVMVTNGECMEDALIVAEKLGIEVVYLDKTPQLVDAEKAIEVQTKAESKPTGIMEFNDVWERYIIPLQGKLLKDGNRANEILKVDWGGKITRRTSKGKIGRMSIEDFRMAYGLLERNESAERSEINQVVNRCSSGIVLVFLQVPFIGVRKKPITLYVKE